jgi:hypothetical protein
MNTFGITEDFTSTNAIDTTSIPSIDQLPGDIDIGIIGYSGIFDFANFNVGQPQGVSNSGIATTINFIGNVDIG